MRVKRSGILETCFSRILSEVSVSFFSFLSLLSFFSLLFLFFFAFLCFFSFDPFFSFPSFPSFLFQTWNRKCLAIVCECSAENKRGRRRANANKPATITRRPYQSVGSSYPDKGSRSRFSLEFSYNRIDNFASRLTLVWSPDISPLSSRLEKRQILAEICHISSWLVV